MFQPSGNYLTDASVFQLSGNYLTNASLFQSAGNYITTFTPLSGTYLSVIDASTIYPTSTQLSTALDLYLSKDLAADTFQDRAGMINYLTTDNASNTYQAKGNYLTTYTPLSGTYLSIIDAQTTYQLSGNYITNASLFQLSGNYLPNASLFQLANNYLTNASLFQLSGNYITTFTPLSGTYLSAIDAGSTYQTKAHMANYIASGSLITYVTSESLTKASVGLGNVDNTSDANKPVSTATQTALNLKANLESPTFTGTLTTPAITLNGNDLASFHQPKFIVAGYVLATGVFGASYGRVSFTSSRTTTGYYAISFSSSVGSVGYSVIGGLRNAAGYISYNGTATVGVNILTYNTAGTLTDNALISICLSK